MCVYAATGAARAVVQRDDALLTADEVQKHWPEVMTAIKQEPATRAKNGCTSRTQRKLSRNILDVEWVVKWKFEQDARSVHESQQSGQSATRRVIRARLTVRCVKDVDAPTVGNDAGTSQRNSERALVSVAVQNKLGICTADRSKAFLQREKKSFQSCSKLKKVLESSGLSGMHARTVESGIARAKSRNIAPLTKMHAPHSYASLRTRTCRESRQNMR